jgi:cytoskeletal protein CcmA (bactofilin family)
MSGDDGRNGILNFFSRARASATPPLETVIGASANMRGTIQSDGGVRLDGIFEGLIETAGNVVVGPGARVVADITARNVTVAGAVKGNIDANGRLEILSTGAVYGDVVVEVVMIDPGGQFQGVSRMRGLAHPALAAPVDAAPVAASAPADEVDVVLDTEPLEATARHVPDQAESEKVAGGSRTDSHTSSAGAHGTNGSDGVIEFDLDGLDLDIEPVIPDSEPSPAQAKSSQRRRPASG